MRLEDLVKMIIFFDMDDAFKIIQCQTVTLLEGILQDLFAFEITLKEATDKLGTDLTDQTFSVC